MPTVARLVPLSTRFTRVVLLALVLAPMGVVACSSTDDDKSSGQNPAPTEPVDDKETPSEENPEPTKPIDDPGSTPTCSASLDGDCGACMKESCCEALTACESDPDCLACVNAQDTDACERTEATHQRVDKYLTCRGGACQAACIGTATVSCEGLLDKLMPKDCVTCMQTSCCEQVAACSQAAVCWDGCFTNHNEAKCHGDPDGHAVYHAMGSCANKHCAAECL